MKTARIVKFNLYMSCILLSVTLLVLIGVTVAYFSDFKQVSNTMTAGNVKITLSEAAVKKNGAGDLVEDTAKPRVFGGADVTANDYGRVYPGQSIFKDPTITNVGSENAWIAAKVTVTDGSGDLTQVMGYQGFDGIDIQMLLSGGVFDETVHFGTWNGIENVAHNDRYAMVQVPNAAEGEFSFYFFFLGSVAANESVTVFENVSIPAEWNNSEMQQLADLKIHVQAFGVQTFELDSCLEAMTGAFPAYFPF